MSIGTETQPKAAMQCMPIFRNNDLELHYLERGTGEPVLLIHGLGSSGADWAFQMPALEKQFHVIAPDLPGSGHSSARGTVYSIKSFAESLWSLLDGLEKTQINIVGFSLGGAVALEMALQRPNCVPRLVLINSLASYQIDDWRKWFEVRKSLLLVRVLGMRHIARLIAGRLFPHPWQQPMRNRTRAVVSNVHSTAYVGMTKALQHWNATDRLELLQSRTLLIAAEHDYTPLAEKHALATQLHASIVVVRGSRHGTPFDSIVLTNASLLALLTDQVLPDTEEWEIDAPERLPAWPQNGSIAHEHASGLEPEQSAQMFG